MSTLLSPPAKTRKTHRHHNAPNSTATPPATTMGAVAIQNGFTLPGDSDDNTFAAHMRPPRPAKEYVYASSGAITEGHYTEF